MDAIWILGASGRAGRAIAAEIRTGGIATVLVGRDGARLDALAGDLGGSGTLVAASTRAAIDEIVARRPPVVINTVGPFADTALPVARACLEAGAHYVDLANELAPVRDVLSLDRSAVTHGCCLVTGAGFGVLATESVVLALRGDRPPAARARVDAVPFVDGSGPAVLASVIDSVAAGGRRYEHGGLVRVPLGGDTQRLTLPDGSSVATVGVPTGDLEAAHRASGAPYVVAASSEVPAAAAARALLPVASRLLAPAPARTALKRLVSRVSVTPPSSGRDASWGHARLEWDDGTVRAGWLRVGEGYGFTARVAGLVAMRLHGGGHGPGAFTPGELFGAGLAEAAGGELLLEGVPE